MAQTGQPIVNLAATGFKTKYITIRGTTYSSTLTPIFTAPSSYNTGFYVKGMYIKPFKDCYLGTSATTCKMSTGFTLSANKDFAIQCIPTTGMYIRGMSNATTGQVLILVDTNKNT